MNPTLAAPNLDMPTTITTLDKWRELSDRLIVDMAIDAAAARIATAYSR